MTRRILWMAALSAILGAILGGGVVSLRAAPPAPREALSQAVLQLQAQARRLTAEGKPAAAAAVERQAEAIEFEAWRKHRLDEIQRRARLQMSLEQAKQERLQLSRQHTEMLQKVAWLRLHARDDEADEAESERQRIAARAAAALQYALAIGENDGRFPDDWQTRTTYQTVEQLQSQLKQFAAAAETLESQGHNDLAAQIRQEAQATRRRLERMQPAQQEPTPAAGD